MLLKLRHDIRIVKLLLRTLLVSGVELTSATISSIKFQCFSNAVESLIFFEVIKFLAKALAAPQFEVCARATLML
jgi:hypothetical protein